MEHCFCCIGCTAQTADVLRPTHKRKLKYLTIPVIDMESEDLVRRPFMEQLLLLHLHRLFVLDLHSSEHVQPDDLLYGCVLCIGCMVSTRIFIY